MLNDVRVWGTNTASRLSGTIWGNCPIYQLKNRAAPGFFFYDDFVAFNITPATTEGNWAANYGYAQFSDTGGTLTAPAISAATASGVGSHGVILASNDDNEGASFRSLVTPFTLNRLSGRAWFECRVKKSSIANTILELFVGLMENTALTAIIPITTTAATLADKNLVGFYSTESAGSTGDTTYKANGVTAVTVGSAEVAFVADTFTNLGFKYTPSGDKFGSFILSFYQDGVRLASYKQMPATTAAGTDFPNDIALGPVIAVRNAAGSSPGTATLQCWAGAQEYNPAGY